MDLEGSISKAPKTGTSPLPTPPCPLDFAQPFFLAECIETREESEDGLLGLAQSASKSTASVTKDEYSKKGEQKPALDNNSVAKAVTEEQEGKESLTEGGGRQTDGVGEPILERVEATTEAESERTDSLSHFVDSKDDGKEYLSSNDYAIDLTQQLAVAFDDELPVAAQQRQQLNKKRQNVAAKRKPKVGKTGGVKQVLPSLSVPPVNCAVEHSSLRCSCCSLPDKGLPSPEIKRSAATG